MSQASMFIIVNSLVREIFSIITPILHILTFLSYFANFYNSWNLSHLVALVKIWVRWNEKKVGKYEKILSCIDRSNICKSGEPRLRVVLIQLFLHLGIKKKKEKKYARALRIRDILLLLFLCSFLSSRMNNILLHASRFFSLMLTRLFSFSFSFPIFNVL